MLQLGREPSRRALASALLWAAKAGLSALALLAAASPAAGAPRVRVHAGSTLDVRPERAGAKLYFRGALTDDSSQPLGGETVRVAIDQGAERGPALVEPCDGGYGSLSFQRGHEGASVRTDPAGRFCVSTTPSDAVCTAHVEWSGTPLVDAARVDVAADLSHRQIAIDSTSEPVADLARESFTVGAAARVVGDGPDTPAVGLPLVLSNEAGIELARATTSATGRATFRVAPASKLGPPGRGELRLDFAGDASSGSSRRVVSVERRVAVLLRVPSAQGDTLPAADPSDDATFAVEATTATGTPAPTGVIEALVDGRAVGSASIQGGKAELVVTLPAEGREVPLVLRYANEAPWYAPAAALSLRVPLAARERSPHAALLLAGLAVLLWLGFERAPRRRKPARERAPRKEAPVVPKVTLVRPAARGASAGWTGRVVDAHEGDPLRDVRLRIERPGFEGIVVLAEAVSDDDGRFELRSDKAQRGDHLVATTALHANLRRELPARGELEVAVVLRRRAVVDRLVAWARRRGPPYHGSLEPTPGHVQRAARGDPKTGEWASAVQAAAFGPETVDAAVEGRIDALAPEGAKDPT